MQLFSEQLVEIAPHIYLLKKFNWDYLEALSFQEKCVEWVYENQEKIVLIVTSHPHCLTMGRGLQKSAIETHQLIEYNEEILKPFVPLYKIKRGGGLTFHYPGQLVIYPILHLPSHKKLIYDFMLEILNGWKELLGNNFSVREDLLGLWHGPQKVGSIGLAASRFVTYHGLALNLCDDPEFFSKLANFNPCGIAGNRYQTLGYTSDDREKMLAEWLAIFRPN